MLRLLLADPHLRMMITDERLFLHQQGCRMVSAANGPELVRLARQERPHLVIFDADLLGGRVDSVLRELRQVPGLKRTPIFATTARWREAFQELVLGAGADAILARPVDRHRLYKLVRAAGPAMALDIRVPAGVQIVYTTGGLERTARVVNLSRGGLFLEADEPSPVGTRLALVLSLPAFTNRVRVNGAVAWVNDGSPRKSPDLPHGMGVRFIDTPVVTLKTIALYVLMSKDVLRVT